jgi:hypothetical protein
VIQRVGLLVLGVELGFALLAAEGDGFAVFAFAGDAGVSRLAADGAFVSRHGDGAKDRAMMVSRVFINGVWFVVKIRQDCQVHSTNV